MLTGCMVRGRLGTPALTKPNDLHRSYKGLNYVINVNKITSKISSFAIGSGVTRGGAMETSTPGRSTLGVPN